MFSRDLYWVELSDIFLVWAPMDFLKGAQVGPMGPSWAHGDRIPWGQLGLINYGPFVVCPFGDLPSPLLPHNGALSLLAGAHGHPLCDRGRHGHRGSRQLLSPAAPRWQMRTPVAMSATVT